MRWVKKPRRTVHWQQFGQVAVIVVGTPGANGAQGQQNISRILQLVECLHIPINQKIPLWQAVRTVAGSGPTVVKGQDDVWVRPVQDVHLDIDWFPQHFDDWIVLLSVEGGVRRFLCNGIGQF